MATELLQPVELEANFWELSMDGKTAWDSTGLALSDLHEAFLEQGGLWVEWDSGTDWLTVRGPRADVVAVLGWIGNLPGVRGHRAANVRVSVVATPSVPAVQELPSEDTRAAGVISVPQGERALFVTRPQDACDPGPPLAGWAQTPDGALLPEDADSTPAGPPSVEDVGHYIDHLSREVQMGIDEAQVPREGGALLHTPAVGSSAESAVGSALPPGGARSSTDRELQFAELSPRIIPLLSRQMWERFQPGSVVKIQLPIKYSPGQDEVDYDPPDSDTPQPIVPGLVTKLYPHAIIGCLCMGLRSPLPGGGFCTFLNVDLAYIEDPWEEVGGAASSPPADSGAVGTLWESTIRPRRLDGEFSSSDAGEAPVVPSQLGPRERAFRAEERGRARLLSRDQQWDLVDAMFDEQQRQREQQQEPAVGPSDEAHGEDTMDISPSHAAGDSADTNEALARLLAGGPVPVWLRVRQRLERGRQRFTDLCSVPRRRSRLLPALWLCEQGPGVMRMLEFRRSGALLGQPLDSPVILTQAPRSRVRRRSLLLSRGMGKRARRALSALMPWDQLGDPDSSEGTSPSSSATDSAASQESMGPRALDSEAEDARVQALMADYDEVGLQADLARRTQRGMRQAILGATQRAVGRAFWMGDPVPAHLWPGTLRKTPASLSDSSSPGPSSPPDPPRRRKRRRNRPPQGSLRESVDNPDVTEVIAAAPAAADAVAPGQLAALIGLSGAPDLGGGIVADLPVPSKWVDLAESGKLVDSTVPSGAPALGFASAAALFEAAAERFREALLTDGVPQFPASRAPSSLHLVSDRASANDLVPPPPMSVSSGVQARRPDEGLLFLDNATSRDASGHSQASPHRSSSENHMDGAPLSTPPGSSYPAHTATRSARRAASSGLTVRSLSAKRRRRRSPSSGSFASEEVDLGQLPVMGSKELVSGPDVVVLSDDDVSPGGEDVGMALLSDALMRSASSWRGRGRQRFLMTCPGQRIILWIYCSGTLIPLLSCR